MLKINVENRNIEKALKILKRKVRDTKQKESLRDNQSYTTPSEEKRETKNKAIHIEKKKGEDD